MLNAAGARADTETSCWVAPGQVVDVAGRRISGGLFYLGSGLGPLAESYWLEVEPALVDPPLPVARRAAHPAVSEYAFSYESLAPADRAAYLDWLASGRRIAAAG